MSFASATTAGLPSTAPPNPGPAPDVSISVLIVDTNRDDALALANYLRAAGGFRVDVVCDTGTALERARRDPPDTIICEIDLPVMSGLELATRINRSSANPPFWVAYSARPQRAEDLFAAGFARYFRKPTPFLDIETAIRLHVYQRSLKTR
jgi:CheY-like chemotaxis protein